MQSQISLSQRLYRYKIHHVLFWMVYFIFWVSIYRGFYPTIIPLLYSTSIYMVANACSVYLVIYFLIPRYLYRGRIALFFLLTFTAILGISLFQSGALYWLFRDREELIDNVGFVFVGSVSSNLLITSVLGAGKAFIERVRSEQDRLKTELQYLKAQVNPHFLFNAINSVYFLIKKNPDQASETLIKLSDLLRFQLYDCSEEKIPIEKELEYVQNYVSLEKIRKGEKVKVHFMTEGMLAGFLIEPFLLIPFLENAFKFVSNYSDKPNTITISLEKGGGVLKASFVNTHDNQPRAVVGGIGLKNVKRRLELLYPGKHILLIDEKPDIYTVALTLQLT